VNEEKLILGKLETIYFGKKENEKLTMHEIGVILDYVALLERKSKQLQQKENIIKEVREYVDNDFNRFDCFGSMAVSMEMNYKREELLEILDKEVN
jgi:hypothetical protein